MSFTNKVLQRDMSPLLSKVIIDFRHFHNQHQYKRSLLVLFVACNMGVILGQVFIVSTKQKPKSLAVSSDLTLLISPLGKVILFCLPAHIPGAYFQFICPKMTLIISLNRMPVCCRFYLPNWCQYLFVLLGKQRHMLYHYYVYSQCQCQESNPRPFTLKSTHSYLQSQLGSSLNCKRPSGFL